MIDSFYRPATLTEASALLADLGEDALAINGGTMAVLLLKNHMANPNAIVTLDGIREETFTAVTRHRDVVRVGAGTTLSRIAGLGTSFGPEVALLAMAAGSAANVRVRNAATLGGNLAEADYASDLTPALICLQAICHVIGDGGRTEREVLAKDLWEGFYSTQLEADELISHVPQPGRHSTHS